MRETRYIKRYQNRKLYDTKEACYITLADIYDLVQKGEEITVIDNRAQQDITAVTLFDAWSVQKKNEGLTLTYVNNLIKGGK